MEYYVLCASAILALMLAGLEHFLQDIHFWFAFSRSKLDFAECFLNNIPTQCSDAQTNMRWWSLLAHSLGRNCCHSPYPGLGVEFSRTLLIFRDANGDNNGWWGGPDDAREKKLRTDCGECSARTGRMHTAGWDGGEVIASWSIDIVSGHGRQWETVFINLERDGKMFLEFACFAFRDDNDEGVSVFGPAAHLPSTNNSSSRAELIMQSSKWFTVRKC